jgi:SAM-dependent methyltransferase
MASARSPASSPNLAISNVVAEGLGLTTDESLIEEQIAYYRARAPEYDQRLKDLNRYIRLGGGVANPTDDPETDRETALALAELDRLLPVGNVLELACGTGWWTQRLAQAAEHVTAVDAAPEMLALNRERVGAQNVEYVLADVLSWAPDRRYDLVFFGFWLSHVPAERFESFWDLVDRALAPGGHFFFVDEQSNKLGRVIETHLGKGIVKRTTRDGRVFRAIKVYHRPASLQRTLRGLGWDAEVRSCGRYFYFGRGTRSAQ